MYASTNISLISRTQAQLAYFFNCLYALSLPGVYVISNKSIPVYNPETDTNNIYINGRYNTEGSSGLRGLDSGRLGELLPDLCLGKSAGVTSQHGGPLLHAHGNLISDGY